MKKRYPELYRANTEPSLVDVPELGLLTVEGKSTLDSPQFTSAVPALYAVAYAVRARIEPKYSVAPLEGRFEGYELPKWTLQVPLPPEAGPEVVGEALLAMSKKKPELPIDRVRFQTWHEGPSAQILHVGPYREQTATIRRLVDFVEAQGAKPGEHHEIYLSDPRRVDEAKLKTIIRYSLR
ncbi:GyrI-like domain-containing protein [Amycolatopsis albispora]|uniref:GyrI-like small molecule binding domain-containing protein n=1 Tax=Amycolatopsis albispora TaxID=1804986 RepID=A0A344LIA6_9PSEU|nr:GyrI-like domain-containing protein [Amycolatopsis albispora]AXB47780.1 hypothetical protein A4R43_39440 [Amycolatopsis albispora]